MGYENVAVPFRGWTVIREIGHGGFGKVYEIRRDLYGFVEQSAMKVISVPQDPKEIKTYLWEGYSLETLRKMYDGSRASVLGEYQTMARLKDCPNIVRCEDIEIVMDPDGIGSKIYIRMELLTPIREYEKLQSFKEEEVIRLGSDICTMLMRCEEEGIVHRDIKPENIMVSDYGDYKLGDFGIARSMDHTTKATKIGTINYMAPEVYLGRKYGHTADIYSLGLVLYWLLNNKRMPFFPQDDSLIKDNSAAVAQEMRMAAKPIPRPVNGRSELIKVVLKALAYDPAERFQSALEFGNEIRNCLSVGSTSETPYVDENDITERFNVYEKEPIEENSQNTADSYVGTAESFDSEKPFGYYKKAPEQRDAAAQRKLGDLYFKGMGVPQDYKKAYEYYKKAAEQEDGLAQCNLGIMYEEGYGVQQSYSLAAGWYRKAAEQGVAAAQSKIGSMYEKGEGVQQNYLLAAEWYKKASKDAKAFECYMKAAEQGDATAQYEIGFMYARGEGVQQNYFLAAEWYKKAAAQECSAAQRMLGDLYLRGQGVPGDYKKAYEYYKKAANNGNIFALINMGYLYEHGYGVHKNLSRAVFFYKEAADSGNCVGQYELGACYFYGKGVPQDCQKGIEYYRKAAEQENTNAQNDLGICYKYGTVVPKDLKEAAKWFRKSAEQGNAFAQGNLGVCYTYGEGVPKDLKEAVKWLRKSAEQGNSSAQNNLGRCYRKGWGVPENLEEAVIWYRKSAEQGNAIAQFNLGGCYEYGLGVPKELKEAVKWYRKSAKQGNAMAKQKLGKR